MIGSIRAGAVRRAARLRGQIRMPGLKRCAFWGLQAAIMLALTGSRLLGDLSPFAMACFAAGLACGWQPVAMAAGCGIYGLAAGWPPQALSALAGCALALAGEGLGRRFIKDRPAAARDVLTALLAGAATLLPGLAASGGLAYNLIAAVFSSAIAALLAPALTGALSLRGGRRRLLPDERLSCALLVEMTIVGLGSLPYIGGLAAECAAALVTMLLAARGPAMGALGGVACGAALALGSGVGPAGSALGLCGLLAGCARTLPRSAAALGFALGNALTLTQGLGFTLGGVGLSPLLIASALYCALPEKWLRRAGRLMEDAPARCDPERLALRLRRETGERLTRLAVALRATARGLSGEDAPPQEAEMVARLREALCPGCGDYARCWQGDHPEAGRLMCRLLSEALCRGDAPPLSERPPELVRHCRRSAQMDRRLQPILNGLAADALTRRRRSDLKGLLSRQLGECAGALERTARPLGRPAAMDPETARLAAAALERAGLKAAQVTACREGGLEICAALSGGGAWRPDAARRAVQALQGELGVRFERAAPQEADSNELCLRQAPALAARVGVSAAPPRPGEPCGDTAWAGPLPDGRLMAVLSDGMGGGARAAAESRKTVGLLRTFLEAGLSSESALEAVNALLQARRDGELFATVDLCVLDLNRGEASLSKLGACSSLLLTGGQAVDLAGGHLPIGILERVTPGRQQIALRPGDTLILYSDGVADDLQEGQREWLRQTARELASLEPEELARALMRAAAGHHGRKDDMSVAAVRILAAA